MSSFLLVIDQGTTSTRAMLFDQQGAPVAKQQLPLQQYFPHLGWVEHEAEEIWQAALSCCQQVMQTAHLTYKDIAGIGITNQRETTVIWDKRTGIPIYNAIVWQDRRTAAFCQQLRQQGHEPLLQAKTGLILDPYFSASKIRWLLDNVPAARLKAEAGQLAFGTIDSFLLWRFTGGASHATDASNAARTLLFNIHTQQWDEELLQLFAIPASLLPQVLDSAAEFGQTQASLLGGNIAIRALLGDQQAALIGQSCFKPGMVKSTYGTGTFLMMNTGTTATTSAQQLLTTVAYRLAGKVTYALEGSVFCSGSTLQWLRDNLRLIKDSSDSERMAANLTDNGGVYLVPAFTGLGAPYWLPDARATIQGLTRDTQAAHLVRAALEAVAYQTCDLLIAMQADSALTLTEVRVDGGMIANHWLMQFLADILALPITCAYSSETTALGAAYLAGLQAGVFNSLEQISQLWHYAHRFKPQMLPSKRQALYKDWKLAVKRTLILE